MVEEGFFSYSKTLFGIVLSYGPCFGSKGNRVLRGVLWLFEPSVNMLDSSTINSGISDWTGNYLSYEFWEVRDCSRSFLAVV